MISHSSLPGLREQSGPAMYVWSCNINLTSAPGDKTLVCLSGSESDTRVHHHPLLYYIILYYMHNIISDTGGFHEKNKSRIAGRSGPPNPVNGINTSPLGRPGGIVLLCPRIRPYLQPHRYLALVCSDATIRKDPHIGCYRSPQSSLFIKRKSMYT